MMANLEKIKIKKSSLKLFRSYLRKMRQITVIDGHKSTENAVLAGIPQGSRLGQILWILYYIDIIGV